MIIEVASPGKLRENWRNIIQHHHKKNFSAPMTSDIIDQHWWFANIINDRLAGLAGAKKESERQIFLGPCMVFEHFRGLGIQRDFIKAREQLGIENGFGEAVTYTHFQNYPSANNFCRSGYKLCPPWTNLIENDGNFIFWNKKLKNKNH